MRRERLSAGEASGYRPIDARIVPRFGGIRTFARLPHGEDELGGVHAAVLGSRFDRQGRRQLRLPGTGRVDGVFKGGKHA